MPQWECQSDGSIHTHTELCAFLQALVAPYPYIVAESKICTMRSTTAPKCGLLYACFACKRTRFSKWQITGIGWTYVYLQPCILCV
ncbi:hypothetical protein GDO78_004639 [Eleutherodactylus coqui]|uniref:Uncharacterized protein n=1 Tax=Eleutherodactylus coqui TaxID=57060 RepID=A0A8J6JYH2_ELECQ|nr:hypothetical protein GDO78_004639 [Eleutherodactylus coqui]